MGLLLLDRAQLEIKSEGDALALYVADERRGTVPIKLVDRCVIHGLQTRLDSGVLIKLAEAGVTTVLMSPRQSRRVAIVLGPQHNDAAVRLAQALRVMEDPWCCQWALAVVRAKLARQVRTLQRMQAQRPDARKPLFDALQTLQAIQTNLTSAGNDTLPNPNLASLRGHEGAAARAYFAGLAGVLPPALGNRDQLVQVFLNLIKNAAEVVSPGDGEIVLQTSYQHGVRLALPGGATPLRLPLVVSVQDNGSGIPEDIRPHLFDPFVTTKVNGTGLGLALVAKIVGDHGGVIEFDSQQGRTTFRVLLPVAASSLEGDDA